jgi:photosystem II stability/assembly factor-like uncharacterized protein
MSYPQWTNLNPVPDGNDLHSVFFADDNNGWIAGSDGFIIKTTNAGDDWTEQTSGTNARLKSIKFVDSYTGWIVGDSGTIIKTTDSGLNWFAQPSGTAQNLNDLYFYDANIGWAVGDSGTILKTSNGGSTWNLNTIDSVTKLNQVDFVNAFVGWTVGAGISSSGILLKTTDGGFSWEDLSDFLINGNSLYSIDFIDENVGSIGDDLNRTPFVSTDGGYTWNQSTVTITLDNNNLQDKIERERVGHFGVQDFYFKNDSIGYAVVVRDQGWYEYIYKTTDAGFTWTNCPGLSLFTFTDLYSLCVTEAGLIWAVGQEGRITLSNNDGETFSEYLDLSHSWQTINSVFFINENIGWAGGQSITGNFDSGIIYKTTDGGKYWGNQFIGPNGLGERIEDLFFINQNVGWASVTVEHQLIATTDSGDSWSLRTIFNNQENFGSLFFVNHDTGWAVNKANIVGIYKTTDGGFTWIIKNSQLCSSVYFKDENNGWAAGSNGLILKSTDGGETWTAKTSGTSTDLHKVKFYDSNVGMCVGSFGTTLLTSDGGETWMPKNSGITEDLTLVEFTSPSSIWVAGDNGKILSTLDFGESWIEFDSVTNDSIISIGFFNGYSGWVAAGTLFKYFDESGQTHPPVWSNQITITDAEEIESSEILTFGQHKEATDGIDTDLGEYELPPVPPPTIFDSRFILPTTPVTASLLDLRDSALTEIDWTISFQPGSAGYPITFDWDSLSFPEGTFYLKDLAGGSLISINMKNQSSYILSNPAITSLNIAYKGNCSVITVDDGWNMISVPYNAEDMSATNLFPDAASSLFKYDNGYSVEDTLSAGVGYWVKYSSNETIQICGGLTGDSVTVNESWNLFGVYDKNISVDQITTTPPGIIATFFFGFDDGYFIADTLEPGKGYWVRVTEDGLLNLNNSDLPVNSNIVNLTKIQPDWGKIILTSSEGNSITLLAADEQIQSNLFELPPMPPAGIFDVRYSSGKMVEDLSSAKSILINSANYPVIIKVEGINIFLKDQINGKLISSELKSGEQLKITDNRLTSIEVSGQIVSGLPSTFEIFQNYPNPFNPSTKIKFSIPKESNVNLSIYNVLGELVSTLVNESMKPGNYELEFNGKDLASGVYIYRLEAGNFISNKKMILMK